ncbi:MAG: hypothetical protein H7263_17215 [Candidatus Sericytochromatia bacterium]|nr:hypothetical protein [Candidatus Sericytochromatia bacterium]
MNNLENICSKLVNSIDGIISTSLVNLEDGSILASCFKENHDVQKMNNNISSATMEILKSESAKNVDSYISEKTDYKSKGYFKEVFISSKNNFYFLKAVDDLEIAIFIISKKTSNQGLIWSEIKIAIPKVKDLFN